MDDDDSLEVRAVPAAATPAAVASGCVGRLALQAQPVRGRAARPHLLRLTESCCYYQASGSLPAAGGTGLAWRLLKATRRNLNEKIAQLNAAIDDVSAQLRADDAPAELQPEPLEAASP
eukprot:SM000061S19215  [mRNA]  locus=s61:170711:171124:- [translate_table: standard]